MQAFRCLEFEDCIHQSIKRIVWNFWQIYFDFQKVRRPVRVGSRVKRLDPIPPVSEVFSENNLHVTLPEYCVAWVTGS